MIKKELPKNLIEMLSITAAVNPDRIAMYFIDKKITYRELLVRGPNAMKGYLNNEQATNSTLKDNWLFTGDMSRIDQDGCIYIVDRKKEKRQLWLGQEIGLREKYPRHLLC